MTYQLLNSNSAAEEIAASSYRRFHNRRRRNYGKSIHFMVGQVGRRSYAPVQVDCALGRHRVARFGLRNRWSLAAGCNRLQNVLFSLEWIRGQRYALSAPCFMHSVPVQGTAL